MADTRLSMSDSISRRNTLPKKFVSLFSLKSDSKHQRHSSENANIQHDVQATSPTQLKNKKQAESTTISPISPISSNTSSFSGLSLPINYNNLNNGGVTITVNKNNTGSTSTVNSNNSNVNVQIVKNNLRPDQNQNLNASNISRTSSNTKIRKSTDRISSNNSQTGSSVMSLAVPQQSSSYMNLNTVNSSQQQEHATNNSSNNLSPSPGVHVKRFILLEDGSHTHHLKAAKRQEKLRSMLKTILGDSDEKLRGQAKSAVPEIMKDTKNFITTEDPNPPTLFSGLVKQVQNMKKNTIPIKQSESGNSLSAISSHQSDIIPLTGASYGEDKIIYKDQAPSEYQDTFIKSFMDKKDSLSFGEKYGRCQEVIGKGAFGVVKLSHKRDPKNSKNEIVYAVKEFKRNSNETIEKYSKRLIAEFCISSSLRHTNIIDAFDLFQDANGDYREVLEYCSGGDLFTLIIAAGKLETAEADCFFKQLIRGVSYMHDVGVCHRDLKPENLLLTCSGVLKITDFGNAECFKIAWEKDIHLSAGVCGSSPYIAPEEFILEEFDPRPVDIWACGLIYMAMRTGRQLWSSATKDDKFFRAYYKSRKEIGKFAPIEALQRPKCRNVIYAMLDPNPTRRLTAKQLLKTEWVRETKCCNEGLSKKIIELQ